MLQTDHSKSLRQYIRIIKCGVVPLGIHRKPCIHKPRFNSIIYDDGQIRWKLCRWLSWLEAGKVPNCFFRRNPNSFYSGIRVFSRFTRRRLNQNQGPLSFSQVLRVFNVTLHFPCTCKLYYGNMYLQKWYKKWLGRSYNKRLRFRILNIKTCKNSVTEWLQLKVSMQQHVNDIHFIFIQSQTCLFQ